MIFDCKKITTLVLEYQQTQKDETLEEILLGSTKLVESIVSKYDYRLREDLIQEAYYKLQKAIKSFNPSVSNLHNFFTTVIINCCNTHTKKAGRGYIANEIQDVDLCTNIVYDYADDGSLLLELKIHNRKRFPSISTNTIDSISSFLLSSIRTSESSRKILEYITTRYKLSRKQASIVYYSTLIYLRSYFKNFVEVGNSSYNEFTLQPDMKEFLGEDLYDRYVVVFGGINVKV